MGLLGYQPVLVCFGRRIQCALNWSRLLGRDRAAYEVGFFSGKPLESCLGQPEILGQERFRRVAQPVGDAEGAELGKVTIVENQDEVAGLVPRQASEWG